MQPLFYVCICSNGVLVRTKLVTSHTVCDPQLIIFCCDKCVHYGIKRQEALIALMFSSPANQNSIQHLKNLYSFITYVVQGVLYLRAFWDLGKLV